MPPPSALRPTRRATPRSARGSGRTHPGSLEVLPPLGQERGRRPRCGTPAKWLPTNFNTIYSIIMILFQY